MRLVNETPLVAGNTLAFSKDGRELLVIVAKVTFVLVDEAGGDGPRLSEVHALSSIAGRSL